MVPNGSQIDILGCSFCVVSFLGLWTEFPILVCYLSTDQCHPTTSAGGSARRAVCILMPETSTDTGSTAGGQSNTTGPAIIRGSFSAIRGATCVTVFSIHLCDRRRLPGGLGLMHKSSVMPDTCVTSGLALPSGLSGGGMSLVHESSVMPDACVTCGLALPSGLSGGGLSLAHESSVMPDTCVTCGLASPSGLFKVEDVLPVSRSNQSCARYFPRNIA